MSGHTKSYGCLQKEITIQRNFKHGHNARGKESKIHKVWSNMNQRCSDSNSNSFNNYGGRGIKVCYRWSNKNPKGFKNFYTDVGDLPTNKHQIDRINNNGIYSPKNWRRATQIQQQRNTRKNINYTFNDKTQCLASWAEEYKIPYCTLYYRVVTACWSIEIALTTPIKRYKK